jgi:hypothetical protein
LFTTFEKIIWSFFLKTKITKWQKIVKQKNVIPQASWGDNFPLVLPSACLCTFSLQGD